MAIRIFRTVRGVEVEITGDSFDGDPSVGIEYVPEIVTAKRLDDDTDFELTDEEIEKFGIELAEARCNDECE